MYLLSLRHAAPKNASSVCINQGVTLLSHLVLFLAYAQITCMLGVVDAVLLAISLRYLADLCSGPVYLL